MAASLANSMPFVSGRVEAAPDALQWHMRRNCALSPRQVLGCYAVLCTVSVAVGAGFAWLGFPLIAGFTALELLAVAMAWLCYARHACDVETVRLNDGRLQVEQHDGREVRRFEFDPRHLRVEMADGTNRLVRLAQGDRSVCVGRHLTATQRAALASAIRAAAHRSTHR